MAPFHAIDRRQLIQYGGAFLGTSLMATVLGKTMVNLPAANAQSAPITPEMALKTLMAGNTRFVQEKKIRGNQSQARLTEVAQGQNPFAAILGCADSRVPAEIVFDQGLGDLFVCRLAGNIATPQAIGSLEFGAQVLGTKLIMVLGHERCGAVEAAIAGGELPGQIGTVIEDIDIGTVPKQSNTPDSLSQAIKANVSHQVNILKQSPLLAALIAQGNLEIVGAYYNLNSGEVTLV